MSRPTRRVRLLLTLSLGALAVATLPLATPASGRSARAPRTEWTVGDCYSDADVGNDEVDLSSKVSCSKPHAVQITAGAPLPKALVKAGYRELRDQSSATYEKLFEFAFDEACTPTANAKGIYPKKSAAIIKALKTFGVNDFIAGAAEAQMAWVLPDKAAFDRGARDVLCVFTFSPGYDGPTAGDLRKVETSASLSYRPCYVVSDPESGSIEPVSCDETHRGESLIYLVMDAADQPSDPSTWADEIWEGYDEACGAFAEILLGGKHPELVAVTETDPATPLVAAPPTAPNATSRVFDCFVRGPETGDLLPPGTVVAHGNKPVKLTSA